MKVETIDKAYTRIAGVYDWVFGPIFNSTRAFAIEALYPQPHSKVLEVGIGTGLMLPLYPQETEVWGIDTNCRMLDKCERRLASLRREKTVLYMTSADNMPFMDSMFDRVIAAYTMSAVTHPRSVLKEMLRVSKPRSVIVLLNHFESENCFMGKFENAISKYCHWLGFRTNLNLDELVKGTSFKIRLKQKVGLFGYWTLVMGVNEK